MAKEKKEKKPRKAKQATQEQLLPSKIIEVDKDAVAVGVQEKVVVSQEKKRLLPHQLVQTLEALLVRVSNLEVEVKALKK